jgi:hypothetical protein
VYRVNAEGAVVARGESKPLEQTMLQAGIRSAALWDLQGIVDAYAGEGVTISERDAELWFSVCGDRLQEEAARAGARFALEFIRRDARTRKEQNA